MSTNNVRIEKVTAASEPDDERGDGGGELGLLPPGDLVAFTMALARVLGDAELRARLTRGARIARSRLSRWEDACAKMARFLERASGDR